MASSSALETRGGVITAVSAARQGLQCPLQQQLGLGAGLLNLALKGAQLLMKAPPALMHQPNPPVLSALVLESSTW